jgi:hypothetical protein
MTDFTPNFLKKTTQALSGKLAGKTKDRKKTSDCKNDECSPSADAIFFVRLFARACQPVC